MVKLNESGTNLESFERTYGRKEEMKVVRYDPPDADKIRVKGLTTLCHSDILMCNIQVVKEGGENNLHSHAAMDGMWFVLNGRMRFYGAGDELIGEFGRYEGVFVPRGVSYWFESCGDEPLELFQAEGMDPTVENTRVDYTPRKMASKDFQVGELDE